MHYQKQILSSDIYNTQPILLHFFLHSKKTFDRLVPSGLNFNFEMYTPE